MSRQSETGRSPLLGAGAAVLAALCCFAGPAILGALAGATIGATLGIAAAVLCAALVALAVALYLRGRQGKRSAGC